MLQDALDDPWTTAETWRDAAAEVLASNAGQESLLEALPALASSQGAWTGRAVLAVASTGPVIPPADRRWRPPGPGRRHRRPRARALH